MNQPVSPAHPLFNDIRSLIDSARQRAAVAVNTELTQLYRQVGSGIHCRDSAR